MSAAGSGTSDKPIITPSDTRSSIFDVDDEDEGVIVYNLQFDVCLPSILTETSDLAHFTPVQAR